jgi:hypothetical protein
MGTYPQLERLIVDHASTDAIAAGLPLSVHGRLQEGLIDERSWA